LTDSAAVERNYALPYKPCGRTTPSTPFNTLQHINDWNTYFDNQKAALQARLDKLNEEWTRVYFNNMLFENAIFCIAL
jgi:hypothetical protein